MAASEGVQPSSALTAMAEPAPDVAEGMQLTRSFTAPASFSRVEHRAGWVHEISALSAASATFQVEATALATKLEQRAEEGIDKHPTAMVERFAMGSCQLEGCVFVGHTNTDMDSVASAIGAAQLYKGAAARSAAGLCLSVSLSPCVSVPLSLCLSVSLSLTVQLGPGGDDPRSVNGEILHALEFAGLELPPFFQDLPDAAKTDGPSVCFVDTVLSVSLCLCILCVSASVSVCLSVSVSVSLSLSLSLSLSVSL